MRTKIKAIFMAVILLLSVNHLLAQNPVLTEKEISDLLLMREEEKLARDVYQSLYEIYNAKIFNNIAASEQQHMDRMKTLLDTYQIKDPVISNARGEFSNPELKKLYDQLLAEGKQSLSAALGVGVKIEKLDINDLTVALKNTTHADIKLAYNSLLSGSQNHLAAFSK